MIWKRRAEPWVSMSWSTKKSVSVLLSTWLIQKKIEKNTFLFWNSFVQIVSTIEFTLFRIFTRRRFDQWSSHMTSLTKLYDMTILSYRLIGTDAYRMTKSFGLNIYFHYLILRYDQLLNCLVDIIWMNVNHLLETSMNCMNNTIWINGHTSGRQFEQMVRMDNVSSMKCYVWSSLLSSCWTIWYIETIQANGHTIWFLLWNIMAWS